MRSSMDPLYQQNSNNWQLKKYLIYLEITLKPTANEETFFKYIYFYFIYLFWLGCVFIVCQGFL